MKRLKAGSKKRFDGFIRLSLILTWMALSPAAVMRLWAASSDARLYATNNIRVLNVDPDTGDRTLLSGSGQGTGPQFVSPAGVAVVNSGTPLFIAEPGAQRILSVDTRNGARAILSDNNGAGSGPDFFDPLDITLLSGGTLVVAEPGAYPPASTGRIMEVNVLTGNRSVISGAARGAGTAFGEPCGVAVESSGTLLVADRGVRALIRVDPATGDRALVSSSIRGSGPFFSGPRGVAIDYKTIVFTDDVIYFLDSDDDPGTFVVFRIDRTTGDRQVVSSASVGAGPLMSENVTDIEVRDDGTIVVSDPTGAGGSGLAAIFAINPANGDRSILASASVGGGPPLGDNISVWGPRYLSFGSEPTPLPIPNFAVDWRRYR